MLKEEKFIYVFILINRDKQYKREKRNMAAWLIILLILVLIFLLTKLSHFKYKIMTIGIILLLITFYLAVNKNLSDQKISLFTIEGAEKAVKTYFSWIGYTFNNIKSLTGNAAKVDWWKVENKTNLTE